MRPLFLVLTTLAALFLSGCTSQSIKTFQSFQEDDLNSLISSGNYQQKANAFFVINDSSSSMGDIYSGTGFSNISKHSVEKELLNRMNKTIPNIALSSGLRSFGYGPCTDWAYSHLNQAVQSYSKSSFNSAINSLECANGGTPADNAVVETHTDLSAEKGNIAVILLSDGHQYDASPAPAVEALKQQYGHECSL